MKFFRNGMTLQEVKTTYRKLALIMHPDVGGSIEAMQELNSEFDIAYRIAQKYEPIPQEAESAGEFKRHFYSQNGWCGSRYQRGLTTKEIGKIVREYVKYVYPSYKFSITTGGNCYYSELNVDLMEYPVELTNYELMSKHLRNLNSNERLYIPSIGKCVKISEATEEQINKAIENELETATFSELNDCFLDEANWINPVILNVLLDINSFVKSYNYDDSDPMTDYFSTNFYFHLGIGKWNKPAKLVEKTARISPDKPTKAKRITA